MEPIPLNLREFIETSGDSTLVSMSFDGQEATLVLDHGRADQRVSLRIKTSLIFSTLSSTDSTRVCFASIRRLDELLQIQHGVYVPSGDLPGFMDEVRDGLHLAYGLRKSQYGFKFSLTGSFHFVAMIRSLSDIALDA